MLSALTSRRGGWLIAAGIAIVAFVVVNVAASRIVGVRLDLTQDRLFTLSEGTRTTLENLDAPVTLTLYYSTTLGKQAPLYGQYAERVKDMLQEFSAIAGDTLTVVVKDPEPFSETEDEAVAARIQGVPVGESGEKVYFGLRGVAEGQEEGQTIPFFQTERENFLEYDLTKLIYRLSNPERPVIGVISGKQVFGNPMAAMRGEDPDPWAIMMQAMEFFELSYIYSAETFVEADPDLLLIIHPTDIHERLLYAIDQFLLRGGRAMMFVDPWNESASATQRVPGAPQGFVDSTGPLRPLFDIWGVEVPTGAVIGDRSLARVIGADGTRAPYVVWLQPTRDTINLNDAVMSHARQLILPTPGMIRVRDDAALAVEPLVTSTDQAAEIPTELLLDPDPLELLRDFEPTGERYILAARLSGSATTAFPDGAPERVRYDQDEPGEGEIGAESDDAGHDSADVAEEEQEPAFEFPPHIAESEAPMNVVLVADADMLEDRFWVRVQSFFGQRMAIPHSDNGSFLINGLDHLYGSDALLSLRSRGTGQRPFTLVDSLRKEAEARHRSEEQALRAKMGELESRLAELRGPAAQQPGAEGPIELTEESQAMLERFTEDLLETRRALRDVNHSLRRDIEDLQTTLRFVNIGLMPIAVSLIALGLGVVRARRRRRRVEADE